MLRWEVQVLSPGTVQQPDTCCQVHLLWGRVRSGGSLCSCLELQRYFRGRVSSVNSLFCRYESTHKKSYCEPCAFNERSGGCETCRRCLRKEECPCLDNPCYKGIVQCVNVKGGSLCNWHKVSMIYDAVKIICDTGFFYFHLFSGLYISKTTFLEFSSTPEWHYHLRRVQVPSVSPWYDRRWGTMWWCGRVQSAWGLL